MLTQLLTQIAAADHEGTFAVLTRLWFTDSPAARAQLESVIQREFGPGFFAGWRVWRRHGGDGEP